MSKKTIGKTHQSINQSKRQNLITTYIICKSPYKSPNDQRGKTGTSKKRNGKTSRIRSEAIRIEPESPVLREWLLKYNSPTQVAAEACKPNGSENKPKKVWKARIISMDVENLPNVSVYDKIEAKKRLRRCQYYANRIAKYEEHRKIMEEVEEMERKHLPNAFRPHPMESPQKGGAVLDCTDMTKADVKKALYENVQYLNGIANGTVYSKRHDVYQMERKDASTKESLTYNVSMVAFTPKQKLCLSKILHRLFGDNVDYQMKVLLPELCLKIFMERYKMGYDEAYQYLDDAPVTFDKHRY